jgi:hypothetical protein
MHLSDTLHEAVTEELAIRGMGKEVYIVTHQISPDAGFLSNGTVGTSI